MKFEYSRSSRILDNKKVKVKKMKHIIEVKSVLNASNGFKNIKKISKQEYMLLDTGEVLDYNLSDNRSQNEAGLKDTFKKIRDLINNNFTGEGNEIHLTLTYAANMTDTQKLYSDFKVFWKKLKRKYGENIDYLSVIEPQERGAWHCHVLIRHNELKKLYVPSAEISKLWGNGFVKIKTLKGVDNIGAYLSAYLGDIELTGESFKELGFKEIQKLEIKEVVIEGKKKAFIKGGRLHRYPPGMNLYRHSKGIVFPEEEEMKYKDIKNIVGNATPNYTRTVTIIDENTDLVLNQVTYENYNMKRVKNKSEVL